MNPFNTDHPLASQPSWLDRQKYPVRSFVCSTVVLALLLTPIALGCLYDWAMSDIGAEANPFPQPWWALFWGSVIAFALSLAGAFPVVLFYRLLSRSWRSRNVAE